MHSEAGRLTNRDGAMRHSNPPDLVHCIPTRLAALSQTLT